MRSGVAHVFIALLVSGLISLARAKHHERSDESVVDEQEPHPNGGSGYDEDLATKMMAMSAGAYAVSPNECIQR